MSTKTRLRIVKESPIDITALNRADIGARDWSACHIAGDKSKAVDLPPSRKWKWFK